MSKKPFNMYKNVTLIAMSICLCACQVNQNIQPDKPDIVLETIQHDTQKIKTSLNVLRQIKESSHHPLALYSYKQTKRWASYQGNIIGMGWRP